ncbi:MAG: glutaredoxin family protein [Bacillales bacterium]|jgi:glutaredoxin|nr:glutaredoxin family protein [Bacillales bacterium]
MNIEIYTQKKCVSCEKAKILFESLGVEYIERRVDSDSALMRKLIFELDSSSTPTIVINGNIIRGFQEEEIINLISV